MKKEDAIKLFGGVVALADACEILPSAVSQWPDALPRRISDRVIGAAVREGRHVPKRLLRAKAPRAISTRHRISGKRAQ